VAPISYVNLIDSCGIWIQGNPSGAVGIFLTILFIILLAAVRIEYTYWAKKNRRY